MAADLDRAGQGRCRPGRGYSGRAGIPAGPGGTPPGSWGSFADPGDDFIVFRYVLYVFR